MARLVVRILVALMIGCSLVLLGAIVRDLLRMLGK